MPIIHHQRKRKKFHHLCHSDLKLAKKENISLRNLAFLLYEEGDIGLPIHNAPRRCLVL
jgi:hypothetical protein